MQSTISVIVPVYNTAPWLRKCLDSICTQNYRHLEILCVNDGSTDNSAEILAEYARKDERIKIYTQPNAGLSAARNTGLEHATGEWVTGVDSDDYLYPDAYQEALAYCREGIDMLFFGVQKVDEEGAPLNTGNYFKLPPPGEYEMTPGLAKQLNVCFCSKLWRRSLIEELGLRFPVGLVHEDEAMYCTASPFVKRIAICRHVSYAYMERANSIINRSDIDKIQRVQRYASILKYTHNEYVKRDIFHTEKRAYLSGMFVRLCTGLYRRAKADRNDAALQLINNVIKECSMSKEHYALERYTPREKIGILKITRCTRYKLYTIYGVPVWCSLYTARGEKLTMGVFFTLIWSKIREKLYAK